MSGDRLFRRGKVLAGMANGLFSRATQFTLAGLLWYKHLGPMSGEDFIPLEEAIIALRSEGPPKRKPFPSGWSQVR